VEPAARRGQTPPHGNPTPESGHRARGRADHRPAHRTARPGARVLRLDRARDHDRHGNQPREQPHPRGGAGEWPFALRVGAPCGSNHRHGNRQRTRGAAVQPPLACPNRQSNRHARDTRSARGATLCAGRSGRRRRCVHRFGVGGVGVGGAGALEPQQPAAACYGDGRAGPSLRTRAVSADTRTDCRAEDVTVWVPRSGRESRAP